MKPQQALAGFMLISLSLGNIAMADDAASIMQKVHEVKRVDDQIATLSFRFIKADKSEKQAIYTMVWKNMHGKDGYDNKAIFFTDSPPDKRGIAYLGWLRPTDSDKLDDEWIYLPELRSTRRIPHRNHNHSHDDDEFGNSLLTREHLEPRPPQLDDHKITGEQDFNGQPHYLISSTSKHTQHMQHSKHGGDNGSTKRINWVDKNSLRLNRIQFFDNHDKQLLDMKFEWQKQQGYWIWKGIEASKPSSNEKTLLEFSVIKINSRLRDRIFHKRNLAKGVTHLK